MKIKKLIFVLLTLFAADLTAREGLMSSGEKYYDYLALDGYTARPYLNYRTLSDSRWTVVDQSGNIWRDNNPDNTRTLSDNVVMRIYGPELFNSYNSASPYGQNDGALWQGRGLNSSLTGGARIEAYGFELTFKPQVVYSQNRKFDTVPSAYSGEQYSGRADKYGYYGIQSIDAPQRFGDDRLYNFSWGDSEIRYTWKNLTAGFGTQSIWLGPGRINAIMHSNNAAPYPKADIGIRRTELSLFGWDAGDVEARLWGGYLTESDYFDTDSSNNHNLISGLALAYAPSFLEGLTLFANRTYMSKWRAESAKSFSSLFFVSTTDGGDQDVWDQRASVGFDYLIPRGGIEVYGESGINDYGPGVDGYMRYPFHSMVYTCGVRKSVPVSRSNNIRGELLFEWSNFEMSQDFQFQWPSTFYAHHLITQGYTNEGEWLGAGNGTGGNSQYLGFKVYYPKGDVNVFAHRQNPDNDYIYGYSVGTPITAEGRANTVHIKDFKSIIALGCTTEYFLTEALGINGGFYYIIENNPLYNSINWSRTNKRYNIRAEAGVSWKI